MDDYGQPPGHRRARGRWIGLLVTAVVLVIAGVVTCVVVPATRTVTVLAGARAAGLPVGLPGIVPVDLTRPFAGTPVESWADGIDGMPLPAASPVGDFSAEEVTAAIGQVRQLTAALTLDRAVIEERRFDQFLGLLSENQRTTSEGAVTGRSELFPSYLTVLAEGFHLLPAGPKAQGTLSFGPGSSPAELSVETDIVAVYAFDPGDAVVLTLDDFITVRQVSTTFVVRKSPPFKAANAGISILGAGTSTGPAACSFHRKTLVAPAFADRSEPPCMR